MFGRLSRSDFVGWNAFKDSSVMGWLGFILLSIIITFLMTFSISDIPEQITVGTIAQHDIRADRNYEIVDEEATDKFKDEATDTVLNVYDHDADVSKRITERVSRAFNDMRTNLQTGGDKALLRTDLESMLGITIPEASWNGIVAQGFSKAFEQAVISQMTQAMSRYVVADAELLAIDKNKGITVRDAHGKERILQSKDIMSIPSVADAVKKIQVKKASPEVAIITGELIQPNLAFNLEETQHRKKAALANVQSVIMKVEAGETIIRGGSRYEPRHVIILEGIRKEKEKTYAPFKVLGTFILVALVMLSTYYFAERYIRKFAPQKNDLYFIGVVLILILIVLRFSMGLSRAIHDSMALDVSIKAFYYAIPVGGAAMLIRLILNSETALVFSLVSSVFAGVFVGGSLNYTSYCIISSVAAAASIAYADKRSTIFRAGAYTALVNLIAVISIQMIHANSLTEPMTLSNILWYASFAVIGGLSCSIMVMLVTPLAEYVFGYTTDIKLLELANLNHPLLRELVIRAPGTYHHSHLVGILAEAACESIGANPLLARVAAYYHDIGKIRKPLYFVENTTDCDSKYEKLSPHMSALIIASHVKDGMELAKQYKIPKKIADVIVQHHGTKMISFFYDQAVKSKDPELEKVDEKDFRYQGPKPQTREAGILLLADAVEAAVRSLKEKSPSRIQQMVEDVINSSFIEAQLDECDLTLKNLHDIANSFTKILMGIYHQRIEYPKETLEKNA